MTDHARAALERDGEDIVTQVLTFWFGPDDAPDRRERKAWWFEKNDRVDATMIGLFTKAAGDAIAGRLDDLIETPRGALALVLLLDQFPRNIWRGNAKAFGGDTRARAVATDIITRGYDRDHYAPVERMFVYLPFEHSEDLVDQERAVALFERLGDESAHDYALRHMVIIERFGRFPHRNKALGRESTPEEIAFLKTPGSSF